MAFFGAIEVDKKQLAYNEPSRVCVCVPFDFLCYFLARLSLCLLLEVAFGWIPLLLIVLLAFFSYLYVAGTA